MCLQQPTVCPSYEISPAKHHCQGTPSPHCAAQKSHACWPLQHVLAGKPIVKISSSISCCAVHSVLAVLTYKNV